MDAVVEAQPAEAAADQQRHFLHPEHAMTPTRQLSSHSSSDGIALETTADEVPTEEQEEETRNVELNLRRWAEQEKLQRKNSRQAPSRNHRALPTHTTGLVRKLSSSLSRSRNTHNLDNAYEMGGFTHRAETQQPRRYDSVESDEGQFVSVGDTGESSEHQALQADHSHAYYEPDANAGDIGSASFEEIEGNKPPTSSQTGAAPPLATAYDAPIASPDSSESNMAATLAKIRSQSFPTVTVGRASSVQHRRGSGRRGGQPPAVNSDTPYATRAHSRRNPISAIPEVTQQDEADVASGTTTRSDPFASPVHDPSDASSAGAISDVHTSELRNSQLHQNDYPGPNTSMQFGTDQRESEIQTPSTRWYWSDLLLGCGLCSTADPDEEQAAYTNPME